MVILLGPSFEDFVLDQACERYENEDNGEIKNRCYLSNGDEWVLNGLASNSCECEKVSNKDSEENLANGPEYHAALFGSMEEGNNG